MSCSPWAASAGLARKGIKKRLLDHGVIGVPRGDRHADFRAVPFQHQIATYRLPVGLLGRHGPGSVHGPLSLRESLRLRSPLPPGEGYGEGRL